MPTLEELYQPNTTTICKLARTHRNDEEAISKIFERAMQDYQQLMPEGLRTTCIKELAETFPQHNDALFAIAMQDYEQLVSQRGATRTYNIKELAQAFPQHHDALFERAMQDYEQLVSQRGATRTYNIKELTQTFPQHADLLPLAEPAHDRPTALCSLVLPAKDRALQPGSQGHRKVLLWKIPSTCFPG